ncbi:MAG: DedA family protein [Candidatus Pelagibacterales bacterium]|nr:MAG: DedA family protein [Pelagibacterales bacterium]
MDFKSQNFKIYLGSAYLFIFLTGAYFLLINFEIGSLTSYDLIKENRDLILEYKENNIFIMTAIFFIIIIFLNIMMCPMFIPTVVIGFVFGKWLGTLILVFGNTIGGAILYLLAKTFFSSIIEKKFAPKISKFINFFQKNELLYFMIFRFIGGGGTPYPIQNVLPVIFNMSVKNYIIATCLGIVPATFVIASLGSGIEDIIKQNTELSFVSALLSPEIYFPIIGFAVILIIAFIFKKYFFKQ